MRHQKLGLCHIEITILVLFGLCSSGFSETLPPENRVEPSTASAISLLLLPPVVGEALPQLAVDLNPARGGVAEIVPGVIELWAIDTDGRARRLPQSLPARPGTQLTGVALEPDTEYIEARWLGSGGTTVAVQRTLISADPFADFTTGVAGGDTQISRPASALGSSRIGKALVNDWYALTDNYNTSPETGVTAAVIWDDGTGPALVIGGFFRAASGKTVNQIARWDGSAWSTLGSGVNHRVFALAVDASGDLIAGGNFTHAGGVPVNGIARWDGSAWSALGSGLDGAFSTVYALTVDADGNLIAGGNFVSVGGVAWTAFIARWDGSAWSNLSTGMNGQVRALTVDAGGDLIAGGSFTAAGGVAASGIARWDGSAWSALGSGVNGSVSALTVDAAGDLIAGGWFINAGASPAEYIARWDGSAWSALGMGMNNSVIALTVDASGDLIAGGFFTGAGGVAASHIARWDGSAWSALGSGVSGRVRALAVDAGGDLIAGGDFDSAGGIAASRIARWDGGVWSPMGSGMNGEVLALTVDAGGGLIAGGTFTSAGGVAASRIARWDGIAWSPLGSGMGGLIYQQTQVNALIVDGGGDLIAGGDFATAGGVAASGVARWDGSVWSPLGSGMNVSVLALTMDAGGDLIAAGHFLLPANRIARWDGSAWSDVGGGMDFAPWALTVDAGGDLIAGGWFSIAGGVAVDNIARWDGSTWSALGFGWDSPVLALTVDAGGKLIAGGGFNTAGFALAPKLAAHGELETTSIEVVMVNPLVGSRPTTLTATVTGMTAPDSGLVTFVVTPAGVCSDLQLTPLNATTSEASCEVTFGSAGNYTAAAEYSGGVSANGVWQGSVSVGFDFEIKLDQTIDFPNPGDQVFSIGGTFDLSATATSGLPVSFGSNTEAVCTVSAATVTIVTTGDCTLTADQPGDANYNPAPQVLHTISITQADQSIDFPNPGDRVFSAGGTFGLTATATSGLPVSFGSNTEAVCTVSGATVTIVTTGDCTLTADQPGDANYNPAPQVLHTISITQANQTIDFPNPGDRLFSAGGTFGLTATATSGLPVSFGSNTEAVCTVSGDMVTMVSAGVCIVVADQAGDANYQPAPQVQIAVVLKTEAVFSDGFES